MDTHKHTYWSSWTEAILRNQVGRRTPGLIIILHISTIRTQYHIVGFVCEVLICANYARCYRLAEINSMQVNYTDFRFNSIIARYCLHDSTNCLLDCLPMSLYKYFKRVDQYFCLTAWSKRSLPVKLLTYSVTWAASPDCGSKQRGFESSSRSKGATKEGSIKIHPNIQGKSC